MADKNETKSLRVAVPCYGTRVLPRFGQAQEFIVADLDAKGRYLQESRRLSLEIRRTPGPGAWLRGEGVQGVLCSGIHPRFQAALEAEGIWVVWGLRGEVSDVLQQWLAGGAAPPQGSAPGCAAAEPGWQRRGRRVACPGIHWQGEEQ